MNHTAEIRTLSWKPTSSRRPAFELRRQAEVIGRLNFEGQIPSPAIAEVGDHGWTFQYTCFIAPRVSVRTLEMAYVATFEGSRSGAGWLEFINGRRLRWNSTDRWQMGWQFSAPNGDVFMRFAPASGRESQSRVEVYATEELIPELWMVTLLGWYLIVLLEAERSAFFAPIGLSIAKKPVR
jgi:hypothetical protein